MKKISIIILFIGLYTAAFAQDRYISKNGHVWFYSKTPVEVIEAHNNQVASVISTKTGSIAFEMVNKSFKFERALMEEHFNENYMESGKFPKSTFSGKFSDFDVNNFTKDGSYKVTVDGDLTIHGVKKHIKQPGTIDVKGGKIYAKAKFSVKPEDYGIEIPGLVRDKIGKNMDVTVDITYSPNK